MAAADKAWKILGHRWQRQLLVGQLGLRQIVVLHCCVVGLMAVAAADKAWKISGASWQGRVLVGQLGLRQVVVLHCCVVGLMAVAAAAYLEVRLMCLYLGAAPPLHVNGIDFLWTRLR